MFRSLLVATYLVAGGCAFFASPVRGQENSWNEYQRRLAESQKRDAQRYETWTRQRDQRYGEWRGGGEAQGGGIELRDPIVAPGNYTIRLPLGLGNVRVNVPPPAATPAPSTGWTGRVYGDVYSLARQMKGQLREIHGELYQQGESELQSQAAKIYQQCAELQAAAAARRADKELQQQFQDFDELWHPFAHRVARQEDLSAALRQRAAAVSQSEHSLHRLLAIAPAPPYDRVLVAALTHQLADATAHLLEDARIEAQQDYSLRSIQTAAARAKQQAADLDAAVQENAPFASIIEEYEEFDRVWHRLMERAQASPDIDAHLKRVGRKIRQIDNQLHDALLVSSPLANDRQEAVQLSAAIVKAADHLAGDLDADLGRNRREVVHDGQAFATAARSLHQAQSHGGEGSGTADAWRKFVRAWNRLNDQLKTLEGERFEHSREMAQQLQVDIKRLERHFQG